jgi:hypothetical protein
MFYGPWGGYAYGGLRPYMAAGIGYPYYGYSCPWWGGCGYGYPYYY